MQVGERRMWHRVYLPADPFSPSPRPCPARIDVPDTLSQQVVRREAIKGGALAVGSTSSPPPLHFSASESIPPALGFFRSVHSISPSRHSVSVSAPRSHVAHRCRRSKSDTLVASMSDGKNSIQSRGYVHLRHRPRSTAHRHTRPSNSKARRGRGERFGDSYVCTR